MIVGDKVVFEKKQNDNMKLNLLLDLDNTLIHSKKSKNENEIKYEEGFNILCEFQTQNNYYQVFVRNGLIDFLNEIKDKFNIYIYTMGTFDYATFIYKSIEILMDNDIFCGIIARDGDHAGQYKYFYILNHLDNNNTIVIDDTKNIWIDEHKKNLIVIQKFKHDYKKIDNDLEILKILLCDIKKENIYDIYELITNINETYNAIKM
jgi:RNA polymerase II C-terminal domain phosphatase-like 3/4